MEAEGSAPDPQALPVVRWLRERGETLAVAESLTGGLLAAAVVEVPGASAVFRGGLVVYATDLKASLAGVPAELLAERGPVDPEVALALAGGARTRCVADWGLATTGVAGPEPQQGMAQQGVAQQGMAQQGVAVGTVYVAVVGPRRSEASALAVPGDRAAVRRAAVTAALRLIR